MMLIEVPGPPWLQNLLGDEVLRHLPKPNEVEVEQNIRIGASGVLVDEGSPHFPGRALVVVPVAPRPQEGFER